MSGRATFSFNDLLPQPASINQPSDSLLGRFDVKLFPVSGVNIPRSEYFAFVVVEHIFQVAILNPFHQRNDSRVFRIKSSCIYTPSMAFKAFNPANGLLQCCEADRSTLRMIGKVDQQGQAGHERSLLGEDAFERGSSVTRTQAQF